MFGTTKVVFTSFEITELIKWNKSRMIPAAPEHYFFVRLIDVDWVCLGSVDY